MFNIKLIKIALKTSDKFLAVFRGGISPMASGFFTFYLKCSYSVLSVRFDFKALQRLTGRENTVNINKITQNLLYTHVNLVVYVLQQFKDKKAVSFILKERVCKISKT